MSIDNQNNYFLGASLPLQGLGVALGCGSRPHFVG